MLVCLCFVRASASSYLLWFRAVLMVNFATLCSDFASALHWKQTVDQTASSAEAMTAASRSKGTVPLSVESGPAASSPRDRKSVSFSLPLSDEDAGRGPWTMKQQGQSGAVDSSSRPFPPLSSIALLPVKAEIKPEAATSAAASESEQKQPSAQ